MLAGLGLGDDRVIRRGRPPKRAWSRGRGGRGGYTPTGKRSADTEEGMEDAIEDVEQDDTMQVDLEESIERIIDDTDEEDELEDTQSHPTSPVMGRSSFVLGSALADSPTMLQRTVAEVRATEESSEEGDRTSISSATQQLMTERQNHERPLPVEDSDSDDRGRYRAKRRKTESPSSSRLPMPTRKPTSAPSKPLGRMTLNSRAPAPQEVGS